MSAEDITEYWWEGRDLHTIEAGEHFVYQNCTVTARFTPQDSPGIKVENLQFVGVIAQEEEPHGT